MQSDKKLYYLGSPFQIQGDYLTPKKQWNSVQNARVNGAFVTSDINDAKFFAIRRCISNNSQGKRDNKKIYLERLSPEIKPYFYVYTVQESPDAPFIHDRASEYYSTSPIKIETRQRYDVATEIEKLGYEIYVLNEPANEIETVSDNNFAKQKYMGEAIKQGKFHRVNIADLLSRQKKAEFKRGKNKAQTKITNLLKSLQNRLSRK